jgi:GNAT superfamily N-acetyltransferase
MVRETPMTIPAPPVLNLNGYTDLPPQKIATVVTYLEMRVRPRLRRTSRPGEWSLLRVNQDRDRYRALFRAVGEPWLWFSRMVMSDEVLAGILGSPGVQAFALHDGMRDIGLLELDFRQGDECELAYFGVIPEVIGQGAGRYLMNEAIRRAFARPIRRFFVHTCSLDHPAALPFYIRSGFTAYMRAIEVADDPRLNGYLPSGAAPQIPLLEGLATSMARRKADRSGQKPRPRRGRALARVSSER